MDSPDLSNRGALVTGAGGGIGRAIAESMAFAGATVGVHCHRSLSEAEQVVEGIRTRGGQAVLLQADLADPAQAPTLVEQFVRQIGRLDILVHNAGTPIRHGLQRDLIFGRCRIEFDQRTQTEATVISAHRWIETDFTRRP